jgi:hypothetical protein
MGARLVRLRRPASTFCFDIGAAIDEELGHVDNVGG